MLLKKRSPLPGRKEDTEFMSSLKNHLEKANEATDLKIAKDHIQTIITMIGFHDIKISSRLLKEVFLQLEHEKCNINGCIVNVISAQYNLTVNQQQTMTIEVMESNN